MPTTPHRDSLGRYAVIALVAVAAVVVWLLAAPRRSEPRPAREQPSEAFAIEAGAGGPGAGFGGRPVALGGGGASGSAAPPRAAATTTPKPLAALGGAKIDAEQVFARVNGVAIHGRDLVPFIAEGPKQHSVTPEMLAYLVDRAIDRELVEQEVRARHVELAPAQAAMVADVREQAMARGVADEAALHFEEREARTSLLQAALLSQRGVQSIFPTDDDVQRYFEAHHDEFRLPDSSKDKATAWQEVQGAVRGRIATERQQKYSEHLKAMLASMRSSARIDRDAP